MRIIRTSVCWLAENEKGFGMSALDENSRAELSTTESPHLPHFAPADLRISSASGKAAEPIFPRCEANLIEEFESSPRSAYLRSRI